MVLIMIECSLNSSWNKREKNFFTDVYDYHRQTNKTHVDQYIFLTSYNIKKRTIIN
jgi:hypothetical protein